MIQYCCMYKKCRLSGFNFALETTRTAFCILRFTHEVYMHFPMSPQYNYLFSEYRGWHIPVGVQCCLCSFSREVISTPTSGVVCGGLGLSSEGLSHLAQLLMYALAVTTRFTQATAVVQFCPQYIPPVFSSGGTAGNYCCRVVWSPPVLWRLPREGYAPTRVCSRRIKYYIRIGGLGWERLTEVGFAPGSTPCTIYSKGLPNTVRPRWVQHAQTRREFVKEWRFGELQCVHRICTNTALVRGEPKSRETFF